MTKHYPKPKIELPYQYYQYFSDDSFIIVYAQNVQVCFIML